MDELQRQLKAFSKRYGVKGQQMADLIQRRIDQGESPSDAVKEVFKTFGMEDWLNANVSRVIVGTAQDALGEELARELPTASLLEALSNPWDGSGMTLSKKLHGASMEMRNAIITTLQNQTRLNHTARTTAQALYDGYRSSRVIKPQQLPKYLDELTRWTRRSQQNLTPEELKAVQKAVRKVKAQADGLIDDRVTYNHFRTSLNELMDKVQHGSEKAAQKALQTAIEEKSRYVAERIVRTEAARARYDAFIARYGEDDSVVAYRWKLGSRHPAEDICDMYAHADLYGLGEGIFPKDAAPVNPAHPHCLCHYAPVYRSELEGRKRSDNVEENGRAWLEKQPLHIRQAILGVKGEQEWKAGRVGWMEKAQNLSDMFGETGSRIPLVKEVYRKQRWGDFNHYGGDTVKVYEREKIPKIATNGESIQWPEPNPGKIISREQYKELRNYAQERGISLSGFKKFDGDIQLIQDAIDTLAKNLEQFPGVVDQRHPLILALAQYMANDDFAETNGRAISLNANAYRSKKRLIEEYQKLVDNGWFVKGTTYKSIMDHEFGHILDYVYNIHSLHIAQQITSLETKEMMLDLGEKLSWYAASCVGGEEITSEALAAVRSNQDIEFALQYVAECCKIIKKRVVV